jgi:hypothetical protein
MWEIVLLWLAKKRKKGEKCRGKNMNRTQGVAVVPKIE